MTRRTPGPASRRRLAAHALAAFALCGVAPRAIAQQPAHVITRAELEAAGWTRLSELVFAVRGAARATVDGITVQGSLTGIPAWDVAPDGSEWLVLVDGQPVDVRFGGATVLDLLPVALSQLDSVTVHDGPAFAAGRLAGGGVLRLYTRRSMDGLSGSVSHYSGNEVGDPGPLTFTPERTPNVDNSGPFHQARVAWGSPRWDVDAAVRRWTDNLTDPRLVARYDAASPTAAPELWVRQLAPVLRASIAPAGTRHDLHAGAAQLRGTFFVPSMREDQSLRTRLLFTGLSGGSAAPATGGNMAWSYRVHAAQLEAAPYGAPLPSTLASDRREAGAALRAGRRGGMFAIAAGGDVTRHELAGAPALDGTSRLLNTTTGAVFVDAAHAGTWSSRLAASAGRGIDAARGSVLLSLDRAVDSSTVVELVAAADVRAAGDDGVWIDLELLRLGAIATDRRTTLASRLAARRRLQNGLRLALSAGVRRETGLHVVLPDSNARPGQPPAVSAPAAASLGELRASAELPLTARMQGGATYRLTGVFSAPDAFREASQSVPRHLLDAAVTFVPARDIRVRPAVQLASATRWRGSGMVLEPVPAVTRLDLSVEKWMLRRRLRAQLLARNLLNDVERYHPLGADFRLRVYAGATLSF